MKSNLIILIIANCTSVIAFEYFSVHYSSIARKNEDVYVRFGENSEKYAKKYYDHKLRIITDTGVVNTTVLPKKEEERFPEIRKAAQGIDKSKTIFVALDTDEEVKNIYVPKWRFPTDKEKELFISKIKEKRPAPNIKIMVPQADINPLTKKRAEPKIEMSTTKVSEDGNWALIYVSRGDNPRDPWEYGKVLFYKGVIVKDIFKSADGGNDELKLLATFDIGEKSYVVIYEQQDLDHRPSTYLYPLKEGRLGERIKLLVPAPIYVEPEGM